VGRAAKWSKHEAPQVGAVTREIRISLSERVKSAAGVGFVFRGAAERNGDFELVSQSVKASLCDLSNQGVFVGEMSVGRTWRNAQIAGCFSD